MKLSDHADLDRVTLALDRFMADFDPPLTPAVTLPLHWRDDTTPLGSRFSGRKNADALLPSLAAQLEDAAPWHRRRPPIHLAQT